MIRGFQLRKRPHVVERDFIEKEFDFRLATKPRGFQSGKGFHVVKRDIHFSKKKKKNVIPFCLVSGLLFTERTLWSEKGQSLIVVLSHKIEYEKCFQ